MTIIILFALLVVSVALVQENTGIFSGYAGSLRLDSSEDIQLVEEEIIIIPRKDVNSDHLLGGVYIAGLDDVDYICRFKLKNLKNKKVDVQIGFPMKIRQFYAKPKLGDDSYLRTKEMVSWYNFIVQEKQRFDVKYFPEDSYGRYDGLFVWDASFRPNEEKLFVITYSMPMTVAFSIPQFKGKYWYSHLSSIERKIFQYVTETGGSWKGEISKAEFILDAVGFEKYLRGMVGQVEEKCLQRGYLRYPAICRIVEPEGWYEDNEGIIRWEFQDYKPDSPITIEYHFVNIPCNAEDMRGLLSFLTKYDEMGLTEEDIEDIEDIIKSYHGDYTENQRIKEFLEAQRWYPRNEKSEVPDQVLQVLREYKKDIRF
ncbi:hypothetical protein VU12_02720 [Desulfobulbus sp. US4]|nr:hypothetical protein [Desulfobulbus sp. US4]